MGKLEAFDAKKKSLTLEKDTAKIESLKGQNITVISEYGKVGSVTIAKKK